MAEPTREPNLSVDNPFIKVTAGVDSLYCRIGPAVDALVSQYGGRLQELSRLGNMFYVANQAAVTTTIAAATTYTGLCISNPAGGAYNLVIHSAGFKLSAAPAGCRPGGGGGESGRPWWRPGWQGRRRCRHHGRTAGRPNRQRPRRDHHRPARPPPSSPAPIPCTPVWHSRRISPGISHMDSLSLPNIPSALFYKHLRLLSAPLFAHRPGKR